MFRRNLSPLWLPIILVVCMYLTGCPPPPIPTPGPLPKTGQTTTYSAGDDGAIQEGVAWPSPRFTDNANGTITDKLTSLIWTKAADCHNAVDWQDALSYCANLAAGTCGLTDGSSAGSWRLPNVREQTSLFDWENNPMLPTNAPFTNGSASGWNDKFWTSTNSLNGSTISGYEMQVDFNAGEQTTSILTDNPWNDTQGYAWCVRGASTAATPAPVPVTGQTQSAITGDDGSLQKGVASPTPRMTDNSNGTVTDHLTGLIWTKRADCNLSTDWSTALGYCNSLASGSCSLSDSSTVGAWRLPNANELLSLINWGGEPPTVWDWAIFANIQTDASGARSIYWTSTTDSGDTTAARAYDLQDYSDFGGSHPSKTSTGNLDTWCVRGTP